MKIGVFSDVHSNLEALNACLNRLQKEQVEAYIYCGDLIGYGPNPEECVQRILALPLKGCVMGNHDAVFVEPGLAAFFNYDAQIALEKTKSLLSEASIQALRRLPQRVQGDDFCVVHGTPFDPVKEYFSSCLQFRFNYNLWKGQICFVGHTHLTFFMEGGENNCTVFLVPEQDRTISLKPQSRYIINPGSVGKPRDNNAQASFGVWDTQAHTFRFLREPYDVKTTQEKMRRYKFPGFLIDSLSIGL